MPQDTQAIDLTLVISDDEDDSLPIYLTSSTSTPQRVGPLEPDEIQVIESPIHPLNRVAARTQTRKSSRPKPRPRKRHLEGDVPAISSLDAAALNTLTQDNDNAELFARNLGRKAHCGEARGALGEDSLFTPEIGATSMPNANVPCASSTASKSSRSSVLHRHTQVLDQALAEFNHTYGDAERSAQNKPIDSDPNPAGIEVILADARDIDIASAAASLSTITETSKRGRKRSSMVWQNAETPVMSPHRIAETTNGDGPPTPRRSTRTRKKTEAMKQYNEEVGPQFTKRTSRRARAVEPDQSSQGLPAPPPLPSGSIDDDREGPLESPRPTLHSEVSFLNDRSGFSLPSLPPDLPTSEASGTPATAMVVTVENASLKVTGAQRKGLPRKAKDRVVPERSTATHKLSRPPPASIPIGAVHLSPAPLVVKRSSEEAPMRSIPFPPCSPEDGENEYLEAADFADAKLMAACAALDTNGNKAMSAEQVATLCIKRGWLSKDLGASAQACISHAISSYTRRCQKAAKPRIPIISKRILNGGSSEARLYPGLDELLLKRPRISAKERLSGTFYYLDGWVGSARWSSPFAGLDPGLFAVVNIKTQANSNIAGTLTNAPSVSQAEPGPRSAEPVSQVPMPVVPVASRGRPRRSTAMKAVAMSCKTAAHTFRATRNESDPFPIVELLAQSDRSCKVGSNVPTQVWNSRKKATSARKRPSARITASRATVGGATSTEESDYDISLNADDMGEDSSVFRRTQRLLNLETDFAFETDFGSGFVSDMGISGDSSADASSTGTSMSVNAKKVDRKVNSNPTIYLSLSDDAKSAVFPDNPLGPVVWDARPHAIPSKYVFEEVSFVDSTSRDNEDDAVMRDLSKEGFGVYQPTRASSTAKSTVTGITWPKDRTAFREPPDLCHGDMDTPPTSPESFSDAADDDVSMAEANDIFSVEPFAGEDEMTDNSLVDAVRTLRGLLTTKPKLLTPDPVDFTVTQIRELHNEPVRPLRSWSNQSNKISLAPPPCIPSPSSSPRSASSFSAIGAYPGYGNPPSLPAAQEESNDRFTCSWDLSIGIQEQLTPCEVETPEICAFDAAAMEQGVLDDVKNVHRLLFDAVNNLPESFVLSGPESVDMEEFDNFWNANEDDPSPSTIYLSVSSEETNLGVASEGLRSSSSRLNDLASDTAASHVKGLAVQHVDSRATSIIADMADTTQVVIDEGDQIGIKEVDDAMLCSWVEEEDAPQKVTDAAFSPRQEAVGKSGRNGYSESQAPSTAVDPNLLGITKPIAIDVPRLLPNAPLLRSSRNDGLATWITSSLLSQGSKAIPPLAVRPRAMVHCQTVSQNPSSSSANDTSEKSSAAQPITERLEENRRKDRAPVPLEDKLRSIIVDNVAVYALPWAGIFLLRRIDTDFINVSTLCRSLRKPELETELQTLAGAVEVRGNTRSMVNGFWVHLSLVTAKAKRLEMPERLRQVLLDPHLVRRYPKLLATLENLRIISKGLPKFGPPFGYGYNNVAAVAQKAGQSPVVNSAPPFQPVQTKMLTGAPRQIGQMSDLRSVPPVSASSTRPVSGLAQTSLASPALNPLTSEAGIITLTDMANRRNPTAIKRANPLAPPDLPHAAEPPCKRQRPTETSATTSTTSVSRSIRPIIPVGVTTTLGASVIESSSMPATYVSNC